MKNINKNTAKVQQNQKTTKSSVKNTKDFRKMKLELKYKYWISENRLYACCNTKTDHLTERQLNEIERDHPIFLSIYTKRQYGEEAMYDEINTFLSSKRAAKLRDFITMVLKESGYE